MARRAALNHMEVHNVSAASLFCVGSHHVRNIRSQSLLTLVPKLGRISY